LRPSSTVQTILYSPHGVAVQKGKVYCHHHKASIEYSDAKEFTVYMDRLSVAASILTHEISTGLTSSFVVAAVIRHECSVDTVPGTQAIHHSSC
jgi:hypothetical protein